MKGDEEKNKNNTQEQSRKRKRKEKKCRTDTMAEMNSKWMMKKRDKYKMKKNGGGEESDGMENLKDKRIG